MSSVKILHEAAMEYYDLAKLAKIKGDLPASSEHLEKAFVLEKEAALTMPETPSNFMWRYILLRSAGWLAYQCGHFEEAKKLAEAGLNGITPAHERSQLEELAAAAANELKKSPVVESDGMLQFSGVLTSADVQKNFIVVKVNGKPQTVEAESDKVREAARLFLGDVVLIKARKNPKGVAVLEGIGRAA
ncbi:MAG: hypothetical protein IPN76_21435 [Saprospiraceae bacterium]|jgi:hypothetical protein|nr:hypothetical protein [Saprospiraceae bacterium]